LIFDTHGIFKPYEHALWLGEVMGRVRGDPITTALAHPTRRQAYIALCTIDEMSTVQLQEAVGVDRYNLYHHLKKLASLNLVENHRDEGRARWWRAADRIDLPELLQVNPGAAAQSTVTLLHSEVGDRAAITLHLANARDQIGAKQFIQELAQLYGIELELPWNFIPDELVLYSKER